MNDTLSEAVHIVFNIFIFCSAIVIVIMLYDSLKRYNDQSIKDARNKSSVTMTTTDGYSGDYVVIDGSEIFTAIIDAEKSLPIYLEGSLLSEDYLESLRQFNPNKINDLKAKIDFTSQYRRKYAYDSKNVLIGVYYIHN